MAWRQAINTTWGQYRYLYDTWNPPSVDDITGILPVSKGGTGSDTGKSHLTFLNYGLNPAINIDTYNNCNYILARSAPGDNIGTFPKDPSTRWFNLINFFSVHFISQIAFEIYSTGSRPTIVYFRSKWYNDDSDWSNWQSNFESCIGTDYDTSRTRNIKLTTSVPSTVDNGAVVLVYS